MDEKNGSRSVEASLPLRMKEKLAFCSGDIFCGGNQALISVSYMVFLTEVIGMAPALAGAIIMISKLWDAITDPLVGIVSDNVRTRFGRRRPFIFLAGLLIIPVMILMWYPVAFPSMTGKAIYVALSYVFYYSISTLVTVPYSSLSAEITTDVNTRSKVNLTRLLFSLTSTAICTLVPSLLINMVVKTHTMTALTFSLIVALGFGAFFTIPVLLSAIFSHERASYPKEKVKFSFQNLFKPFRIKAFRKLLVLYLAQSVTMDIVSAVIVYYALCVKTDMSSTIFLAAFLGVQIIAFPLVNHLVTKTPKPRIYGFLLPICLLGAAGIGFYPATWPTWGLYILAGLTAVGFAGAEIMPWIIFPDIVDIGVLSFRERNAGSFSSGMTLIRKISSAVAASVIGYVLELTGYQEGKGADQPETAVWGIRLIVFLAFLVLMGIAYFVSWSFKLTPKVSQTVKLLNDKHSQGQELTPEEKVEEAQIIKEFVHK